MQVRRWLAIAVACAAVTGVNAWSSGARASDDLTVSASVDAAAPGMVRVAWVDPIGRDLYMTDEAYRIQWWSGATSTGEPLGSAVLDARGRPRVPEPVVIPNLDAGTYTVRVDVVDLTEASYGAGSRAGEAQTELEVASVEVSCEGGKALCFSVAGSVGSRPTGMLISGGTGSGIYPAYDAVDDGVSTFSWTEPDDAWVFDNVGGAHQFTRARVQLVDNAAIDAGRWWTAFGDEGLTASSATQVLLPASGDGSVNLGTVTMVPGVRVGGVLTKSVGGQTESLDGTDFGSLCVDVFANVGAQTWEQFNTVCGYPEQGFGVDPEELGRWQIALPAGKSYRVLFVDRANYYGLDNVLLYNVKFARHWWRSDGGYAENVAQATDIVVGRGSAAITGIDGVLRPSKQLRLDVVDIPAEIDVSTLQGRIAVVDEFDNWTGGAMQVDAVARTVGANVTGLVDGREYKIFLSFSGPGNFSKWWLVGGGTLDDATGSVPAELIREPWPVDPLLVTLHRSDGTPFGPGDACVVMAAVEDPATPLASACTEQYGVVRLQRVPAGAYRVVAYQRDDSGALVGEAVVIDPFIVDLGLPAVPSFPGYVYGIADTSRLSDGSSLQPPYSIDSAVVLETVDDPAGEVPLAVGMVRPDGSAYGHNEACVSFTESGVIDAVPSTFCVMENPLYPGLLLTSPLAIGSYDVTAFAAVAADGSPCTGPVVDLGTVDIGLLWVDGNGYALGLHGGTLNDDAVLPSPYQSGFVIAVQQGACTS